MFHPKTLAAAAALAMTLHTASASPILVVSNNTLMGATGLEVGGRQYDVTFGDARPGAAELQFTDATTAWAAAAVLRSAIFQGAYDVHPNMTNGCSSALTCTVVTAYRVRPFGVEGIGLVNTFAQSIDPLVYSTVPGNSAAVPFVTYARWSVHAAAAAVPEPSTLLLAGLGLGALALGRRRR